MSRTSPGGASYAAALAAPEFRAIFAAFAVAVTGSVVATVALTVEVYERTRSPLLSSLAFAVGFVPYVVGGTLLSGIVDRIPPRRLLTSCALGSAGLTAAMVLPGASTGMQFVLVISTGVLTSLSSGAQGGLVRSAVPEATYVPARSLLRIAAQVAQVGGNAFGAALLAVLTPDGAFLVSSAAMMGAAAILRFGLAARPATGAADEASLLRDSVRGLRLVFAPAGLRRLLLLGWLVPMFSVAPEALAAPYVAGRGGSPALVGLWLAALPAGMVAGDLLGVWRLSAQRQRSMVGLAACGCFVPYLVFMARPPIVVAVPLLAGAGLCGMYSLGLDSLVRQVAPEQLFARTMAISTAGLITLQGLGFALAGGMAQLVGPAWAIAGAGACGLVTVIVLRPRATDLRGLQGEAGLQVREGGIDALEHVRGGILLGGQHGRHDDADHRTGQVADREVVGCMSGAPGHGGCHHLD
jgi:hypothetical protein